MKRNLLVIALAALVILFLQGWVSLVSLHQFAKIETDEVEEDVLQARNLLESEIDQLSTVAGDYSGWDDTYAFVQNGNNNYVTHSLGSSFMAKLRLNCFCVVNTQGKLVLGIYRPPESNTNSSQLPFALRAQIAPESMLLKHTGTESAKTGIISLPEGLMMVASRPILTTESLGPSRGTVIIGRLLHPAEIKRISDIVKFDIGLHLLSGPATSRQALGMLSRLPDKDSVVVQELGKDKVRGFCGLRDLYGKPVALLSLDKERQAYQHARATIGRLAFLACSLTLVAACAVLYAGNKLEIVSTSEHHAHQQLKSFIDLAVDGIFRLEPNGRIRDVNMQATALTGYPGDELTGMLFDGLFSKDDIEQHPLDQDRLKAGLTICVRRNLIRKGEATVPVEIRSKNLPDGTCQCIMQDLTEQLYWEGLLFQQQELLKGIINGTGDIIYAKDMGGRYILINDAGLRFIGKPRNEVLGLRDQDIFPPATARVFQEADQHALTAQEITISEDTVPHASGSSTIFLATRAVLTDKQGVVTGLFAILFDITVRAMLEKELLSQHNRLGQLSVKLSLAEEGERVRIAGELHDQVGPNLLLCKMKLQMLQARLEDEQQIALCETAEELVAAAITDVRSLTLQLRPPILTMAGLESALKWLAEEFSQKYDLQITFQDDLNPKPLQYEKRTILFQAARELLLNAMKHAGSRIVTLSLERRADLIRISIADTGAGFTCSLHEGMPIPTTGGFGLFNVTQKLKHIGGRLSVVSEPGQGATCAIEAPLDT